MKYTPVFVIVLPFDTAPGVSGADDGWAKEEGCRLIRCELVILLPRIDCLVGKITYEKGD